MAQIAVNVGMNLRVLPVIGVTLPFYSAGGSSVLMLYICVGLVLSVYMHNTKSLVGSGSGTPVCLFIVFPPLIRLFLTYQTKKWFNSLAICLCTWYNCTEVCSFIVK